MSKEPPMPPNPVPPTAADLDEVVRRLAVIDQKIDWVARRVALPHAPGGPDYSTSAVARTSAADRSRLADAGGTAGSGPTGRPPAVAPVRTRPAASRALPLAEAPSALSTSSGGTGMATAERRQRPVGRALPAAEPLRCRPCPQTARRHGRSGPPGGGMPLIPPPGGSA